jgi:pyruvate, water dikinase
VNDRASPLLVRVADDKGRTPEAYAVVVNFENDKTAHLLCEGDDNSGPLLSCDKRGVFIRTSTHLTDMTIRAIGYEYRAYDLSASRRVSMGTYQETVAVLEPLPPFKGNEDYFTGFHRENGLDDFKALAYSTDSELGPLYAVKFYISDLDSTPDVYFINTEKHQLHYDFVRDVLKKRISRSQYELETYVNSDRTAMAGTLVYYPDVEVDSSAMKEHTGGQADAVESPFVLTFFPSDSLTPSQALRAHRLIEARMWMTKISGADHRLLYLPAGETQERALEQEKNIYARAGSLWIRQDELYKNKTLQILNEGEAYGTLRMLTPEELSRSIVSFSDIVILTRLPNDLPIVGGTITCEMQTPLAHVNVASISRGTPNIALRNGLENPLLLSLIGRLVHFVVDRGGYSIEESSIEEAAAFWESRAGALRVLSADLDFTDMPEFDAIAFEDSVRVGAKAANVATLSSVLGPSAPYGFAVPFHYYDQFMRTRSTTEALCEDAKQDCEEEGRSEEVCDAARTACKATESDSETLAQYATRLLQRDDFKTDSVLREAMLDGLRYHIRHIEADVDFIDRLDQKIRSLFGDIKVRLRSSTNAEDLTAFTGAGLYKSVSAYSSAATGVDAEEKELSKQIRKVWASIWNWQAYEERHFWNIDHSSVYMAVLVHEAFPNERANGVLITRNISNPLVNGMYVNVQKGEFSVTNPENGATPEIFVIVPASLSTDLVNPVQASRISFSSLSPNAPILSDDEIGRLYAAASVAESVFSDLYHSPSMAFEMEFKFHGPDRDLIIKQIRPFDSKD